MCRAAIKYIYELEPNQLSDSQLHSAHTYAIYTLAYNMVVGLYIIYLRDAATKCKHGHLAYAANSRDRELRPYYSVHRHWNGDRWSSA